MVAPHSEIKAYDVSGYRYLVDVTHSRDGITVRSEDLGLEETQIEIGGIRNLVASCLGVSLKTVIDATKDHMEIESKDKTPGKTYIQAEA
jgi:hypothetical protein